jgi:hypothetical protein
MISIILPRKTLTNTDAFTSASVRFAKENNRVMVLLTYKCYQPDGR